MDLDRIMSRLNPLISWILRSPLHFVLSRDLMLLTVTGRRTGRRYVIPLGYQRYGEWIMVLVSKARRKNWWRNYLEPAPVEMWVGGRELRGEAEVVSGSSEEFRRTMESTFRRLPFLGRQFGISYDRRGGLTDEQLQTVSENGAIVKIRLASDG